MHNDISRKCPTVLPTIKEFQFFSLIPQELLTSVQDKYFAGTK